MLYKQILLFDYPILKIFIMIICSIFGPLPFVLFCLRSYDEGPTSKINHLFNHNSKHIIITYILSAYFVLVLSNLHSYKQEGIVTKCYSIKYNKKILFTLQILALIGIFMFFIIKQKPYYVLYVILIGLIIGATVYYKTNNTTTKGCKLK